jgi:hypothetical protein
MRWKILAAAIVALATANAAYARDRTFYDQSGRVIGRARTGAHVTTFSNGTGFVTQYHKPVFRGGRQPLHYEQVNGR